MLIADRYGSALRRWLRIAERLSDRAMRFGSLQVKTPPSRSSASLSRVTRRDQRFAPRVEVAVFRVVVVRLRVVAMRCFSVETPRLHSRKPLATSGRASLPIEVHQQCSPVWRVELARRMKTDLLVAP